MHPGPRRVPVLIRAAGGTGFEPSRQHVALCLGGCAPSREDPSRRVRCYGWLPRGAGSTGESERAERRGEESGRGSLKPLAGSTAVVTGLSAFYSKPQFSEFITQLF